MSGMIRRLRWKIVGISMLFVTLVLAAVFTGVCLLYTSVLRFFSPLFPHRDDIGKSSEEWCAIKGNMEQRACDLALYVIESLSLIHIWW